LQIYILIVVSANVFPTDITGFCFGAHEGKM